MPAIHEILPADGWRVSSDEDWDVLIKHVGPDAGMKLKSKTGWKYDGNGTDEYGFRALPAGYRNYNGSAFHSRGVEVILWSSSANSTTHACRRALHYNQASAFRDANDRSYGFSVRCIRDIK
jgi:uncharacterized protein (TIGR02145 family)